ncbi:MAG: TonB-dependent receptor plug domain-containing protein, partial [Pseudomonadota bacterium]
MKTFNTAALGAGLCASTAITAVLTATPTAAQEQEDAMTEVIMVTATRRAAGLQDVPLAVTAVSSAQLERNAIFDISNLDSLAPGLSFGASGSDARPSIRGARTETINERQDPVIGFFMDGFYLPRTSQA